MVLQARLATVAEQLADNEATIVAELLAAQGKPVDLSGYYHPDWEKTTNAMVPAKLECDHGRWFCYGVGGG